MSDPQYESYELWARSWAALVTGDFAGAHRHAVEAARITEYFLPLAPPLAARAALWAGDAAGAAELLEGMRTSGYRGAAFGLDQRTIRAGVAALEGGTAEALALYREALRGWRQLGLVFDEALAVVDLVRTLDPVPDHADIREAIAWARDALAERGATPFLPPLDAALAALDGRREPAAGEPDGRPVGELEGARRVTCSSCGTANEAGRKFCKECGAPLALVCPGCGAANAPDAKFCGECAERLVAAPAGDATPAPHPRRSPSAGSSRSCSSTSSATRRSRTAATPRTPASC